MEFLEAQNKDILFVMGLTTGDLKNLKMLLDKVEIVYDEESEDEKVMVDYLHNKLYPTVTWLCKKYMPHLLEEDNELSTD